MITIRVSNVGNRDGRELIVARGYLPSGQLLIEGPVTEGRDPTAQLVAVRAVAGWIRDHRPGVAAVNYVFDIWCGAQP